MRLKLTNLIPPGGYRYTDTKLGWTCPKTVGMQGAEAVARELSQARANNPSAGLDASLEACYRDVVQATYDRYQAIPTVLKRYVQVLSEPVVGVEATGVAVPKIKRTEPSCGSCGARRKAK